MVKSDEERHQNKLGTLRTIFYLSKVQLYTFLYFRYITFFLQLSYLLLNENEDVWSSQILQHCQETIGTIVAYFRREWAFFLEKMHILAFIYSRMPDIMKGPKSHDIEHKLLEDILDHGNPAGYDVNL